MHINDLPLEILHSILERATEANKKEGVTWTYGLSHVNSSAASSPVSKPVRSVRGLVSADSLRWDSTAAIRRVCHVWHDWGLHHGLRDIYVRRQPGSERWAELAVKRKTYDIYELIDRPTGCAVYRDPYQDLKNTVQLFVDYPQVTDNVQRVWFHSFYTPNAEALIFKMLQSCRYLSSITVPWTVLRHGSVIDWLHLLGIANKGDMPVQALEFHAVCLPEALAADPEINIDRQALLDPRVNFSNLKRLKFRGNTTLLPVNDNDLFMIAQTANNLEQFHITSMSTVTINGVMAIVKAAQQTLQLLDHSPRADDGFRHPNPGMLPPTDHACEILARCTQLRDLSVSLPSMCADLFSRDNVRWRGELQVRALSLCDETCPPSRCSSYTSLVNKQNSFFLDAHGKRVRALKRLLETARALTKAHERQRKRLDVELFFAGCIFDPAEYRVHGDFSVTELLSYGHWPESKQASGKGPYGSTGLYAKEEGEWDWVNEQEYLRALEVGWISIQSRLD